MCVSLGDEMHHAARRKIFIRLCSSRAAESKHRTPWIWSVGLVVYLGRGGIVPLCHSLRKQTKLRSFRVLSSKYSTCFCKVILEALSNSGHRQPAKSHDRLPCGQPHTLATLTHRRKQVPVATRRLDASRLYFVSQSRPRNT